MCGNYHREVTVKDLDFASVVAGLFGVGGLVLACVFVSR